MSVIHDITYFNTNTPFTAAALEGALVHLPRATSLQVGTPIYQTA